jgi:hypothetical protein
MAVTANNYYFMKKIIFLILNIIAAALIVFAFFMPWVNAATSVARVSEQATNAVGPLGALPFVGKVIAGVKEGTDIVRDIGDINIDTTVSGYEIPKMVNSESSKVALSFARDFFRDTEGLDKKSMLVYLLPLLAILCVGLAIIGIRYRSAVIFMLLLSGIISLGGLYKLNTLNLSNETVDLSILKGLWYTMYGYLSIFAINTLWIVSDILTRYFKRKKQGGSV